MKFKLTLFAIMFAGTFLYGQQPFEEYGYKVKVATLSKGKYVEFFDQDTLVQVGSVMLNRLTGKLVYFVITDTAYSEATLKPELISRWISPDPLAAERYDFSPYNFVRNNPIIFTDPTGALDEYYGIVNNTLVHLGSDGQGSNTRLVAEGQHEAAVQNLNGSNTTQDQVNTLRSSDMSQVVTFNESNIQSEFQGANDRTITSGLENSVVITLDPATATVDAQPGAQGTNSETKNTFNSYDGGSGMWTSDGSKVALGTGHGHPQQTDGSTNVPGYSKKDSQTAGSLPTYSMDSYKTSVGGAATIHQAMPSGTSGKSGTNPVGTTQNTNDIGKRSFLQVARPYQR